MKHKQYIVSFAKGTSGNFIVQVANSLIIGYRPIIYSEQNNCHIERPFNGITHSNASNDPKIYEYFVSAANSSPCPSASASPRAKA